MRVDPIIEPLMHSPNLPVYLAELNAYYDEEKKNRQAFYVWLSEEVKAEFIAGEVVTHSPAINRHIDACAFLFRLLSVYVDSNGLGSVKMEKALGEPFKLIHYSNSPKPGYYIKLFYF